MDRQLNMFDTQKAVVMSLRPTDRLWQNILEINGVLYFEQRHKKPWVPGHQYYYDTLPSRCEISREYFERGVIEEIGKWTKEG